MTTQQPATLDELVRAKRQQLEEEAAAKEAAERAAYLEEADAADRAYLEALRAYLTPEQIATLGLAAVHAGFRNGHTFYARSWGEFTYRGWAHRLYVGSYDRGAHCVRLEQEPFDSLHASHPWANFGPEHVWDTILELLADWVRVEKATPAPPWNGDEDDA